MPTPTVGVSGIEPLLQDPQPCVLPLYDTPIDELVFATLPYFPENFKGDKMFFVAFGTYVLLYQLIHTFKF